MIEKLDHPHGSRLWLLTAVTLVAFAGNSLLCRAALADRHIDAVSFTFVRLASGMAMLALVLAVRRQSTHGQAASSWRVGLILIGYAILFSLAYEWISAGVGALVLFATVQFTMLTVAVRSGRGPHGVGWFGVGLALAGLAILTLPGADAPDPKGLLLMAGSGIGWGLYSLAGARSTQPVLATAGNFNRATLLCLPLFAGAWMFGHPHADAAGLILAVASGALASGLGYVLWYAVLPALGALRGSIVQLAIPVIASFGGLLLLGEAASTQMLVSSAAILGGIGIVLLRGEGQAQAQSSTDGETPN
jgi:drug/metabolite transporter (DMT)-like permease